MFERNMSRILLGIIGMIVLILFAGFTAQLVNDYGDLVNEYYQVHPHDF